MTRAKWGGDCPYPMVPFKRIFTPVDRPVPDDAEIVTAYTDGEVTLRSNRRLDGYHQASDLSSYQGVEPGDFVVHGLDILRGSVGVSDSRGAMSPVCTVATTAPENDPRFHAYTMRAQAMTGLPRALARGIREGGADFRRWDTLASLPLPTPPLETQRRIADMLDAETARIDELIEKNERVIQLLELRRARTIEDAIFGEEAHQVGIHYLANYINGYPFKPEDQGDKGLPIVRIAQLLNADTDVDRFSGTPDPYCHIDTGDLIFSWSGSLAARIWDRGPAYLNQHLFLVHPDRNVNKRWLLHGLNAAVPRMHAFTHGSTMTHLTRPMMTRIKLPTPDLNRQRQIAREVDCALDEQGSLHSRVVYQIELLETRRRSLITAAVTGQINV